MKQKILFVDDDRRRTEIYVEMLRMEGYDVTFVATMREAENELKAVNSDLHLIILDIMMPWESYVGENTLESRKRGIKFLEQVRKNKTKDQLPVIILTVLHDEETKELARKAGCNDYFEKPCLPSKLLEKVKENLRVKV